MLCEFNVRTPNIVISSMFRWKLDVLFRRNRPVRSAAARASVIYSPGNDRDCWWLVKNARVRNTCASGSFFFFSLMEIRLCAYRSFYFFFFVIKNTESNEIIIAWRRSPSSALPLIVKYYFNITPYSYCSRRPHAERVRQHNIIITWWHYHIIFKCFVMSWNRRREGSWTSPVISIKVFSQRNFTRMVRVTYHRVDNLVNF